MNTGSLAGQAIINAIRQNDKFVKYKDPAKEMEKICNSLKKYIADVKTDPTAESPISLKQDMSKNINVSMDFYELIMNSDTDESVSEKDYMNVILQKYESFKRGKKYSNKKVKDTLSLHPDSWVRTLSSKNKSYLFNKINTLVEAEEDIKKVEEHVFNKRVKAKQSPLPPMRNKALKEYIENVYDEDIVESMYKGKSHRLIGLRNEYAEKMSKKPIEGKKRTIKYILERLIPFHLMLAKVKASADFERRLQEENTVMNLLLKRINENWRKDYEKELLKASEM